MTSTLTTCFPVGQGSQAVDLSIIIAAYNSSSLLRGTLSSVLKQTTGIRYEIIVVDSSPHDTLRAVLSAEFPEVQWCRAERNAGFAAASNYGLRLSRGRYAVLLNPDILLHDNALGSLVQWMDTRPEVGAAGPLLLQPDGVPQPYSYGSAPTPRYLLRRLVAHLRGRYLHSWAEAEARLVDWVAGTCMIVRWRALQEVGLLDEQFFLYFEDVDWGLRFHKAGWPVMFVPTIAITHIGGGSVGADAMAHYHRSLVRFYVKYYGRWAGLGVRLALVAYRLFRRWLGTGRGSVRQ